MTTSPSSDAEPTTEPIMLEEKDFMMKVILHSHKQQGHTGWLDAQLTSSTFDEPGVGRFVKKFPLLRFWQYVVTYHWQPAAQRALDDHNSKKRILSVKNYKLAVADAKLEALDLSNLAVNRLRARVFLLKVGHDPAKWDKMGVAWWLKDVDGFLKVLATEKRKQIRREEKEARYAAAESEGSLDSDREAEVVDWRSKVLVEDSAEAKTWVTEEAKPFGRPAHVAVGVQAGREQAEPLEKCILSGGVGGKMTSSRVDC